MKKKKYNNGDNDNEKMKIMKISTYRQIKVLIKNKRNIIMVIIIIKNGNYDNINIYIQIKILIKNKSLKP